jgi:hypothetical protein
MFNFQYTLLETVIKFWESYQKHYIYKKAIMIVNY